MAAALVGCVRVGGSVGKDVVEVRVAERGLVRVRVGLDSARGLAVRGVVHTGGRYSLLNVDGKDRAPRYHQVKSSYAGRTFGEEPLGDYHSSHVPKPRHTLIPKSLQIPPSLLKVPEDTPAAALRPRVPEWCRELPSLGR